MPAAAGLVHRQRGRSAEAATTHRLLHRQEGRLRHHMQITVGAIMRHILHTTAANLLLIMVFLCGLVSLVTQIISLPMNVTSISQLRFQT